MADQAPINYYYQAGSGTEPGRLVAGGSPNTPTGFQQIDLATAQNHLQNNQVYEGGDAYNQAYTKNGINANTQGDFAGKSLIYDNIMGYKGTPQQILANQLGQSGIVAQGPGGTSNVPVAQLPQVQQEANAGFKLAPPPGSPAALLQSSPANYAAQNGGAGVAGYNPPGTYQSTPFDSNKYQDAANAAKTAGTTSPTDATGANDMYKNYLNSQQTDQMSNFVSQDQNLQTMIAGYQQQMSQLNQQASLADTYSKMMQDSGIQGIDTQLLNMRNVMNGTEDDIRNEVTKAGGFATNSQVQALTDARNKVLLQNYNTLQATRDSKQQYLDTMMNLTEKDRAAASQKFDTMMNFGTKIIELNQTMQKNAIDSLNRTAQTIGWDGVYQATQGNPQMVAQIERTYGLPPGSLVIAAQRDAATKAAQAQTQTLDTQYKQGQIDTQNANIANVNSEIAARNNPAPKTTSIQEYEYAKSQGYKGTYSQYQNEDANRKMKANTTTTATQEAKYLSSTEIQQYQTDYPNAEVSAGDTRASANAKISAGSAPQKADFTGSTISGLTVTLKDGGRLSFPNQQALDQFKKDNGMTGSSSNNKPSPAPSAPPVSNLKISAPNSSQKTTTTDASKSPFQKWFNSTFKTNI